ncbi:hypothetical protein V3C99_011010 [Haemonchus contortus]
MEAILAAPVRSRSKFVGGGGGEPALGGPGCVALELNLHRMLRTDPGGGGGSTGDDDDDDDDDDSRPAAASRVAKYYAQLGELVPR